MVKFWLYSSASLLACAGLLWYTYATRQQFYPAVIYLVTSKISVLVLGNAGLVLTMLFGRLVKSLFLGQLRDAEVELLHENVRYAITETCLALTIFREEINFHVMVLFTALVFLKIFHWLAQARIEFIEQTDVISRMTHVRLVSLMALLSIVDTSFVFFCSSKVLELGPSVYILFGFEFLILLVTLVATFLRYVLYVIDMRMENAWASKFTYLFYLELVSEIVKLIVYLVFFMLIFTYYGMPLHIVRDLWVSIKSLQRRIASYFRYRKITANLNERFPNPTEEELEQTDRTCIICREEMESASCKKLPCSHIFHIDCLKMWVQRQQTCPTCRSTIPTGPRVPPVDVNAPANAAAGAAAVVAPPVANAQPPQPQNQQRFPFGAAFAQPAQAAPVGQPAAPAPQVHGAPAAAAGAVPGGAAPPATGGAHAPAAHPGVHAFGAPGYNPFMPPMMYPPGLATPFGFGGYGMMPPYGVPLGQPGAAQQPAMDPQTIQRQLDLLNAQLAVLQAATGQLPTTVPSTAASISSTATAAPPVSVPTPAAPIPASTFSAPAAPAAAAAAGPTTTNDGNAEALEEKAPAPDTPPQPEERAIPPAPMTEAERRREELRQRYARIYGSSSGADESKSE